MERVVSFHGGLFKLDEENPSITRGFHIGFEGQRVMFNNEEVDLRYKGKIEITRQKNEPPFIVIPLVPESHVWVSFDCEVRITHRTLETFQLSIDGERPVTVKLPLLSLKFDESTIPMEVGQTFHYRRTSGESPRYVGINHNGNEISIPFMKTLSMGFIACIEDSGIPWDSMRLPTISTDNHIQAWKYQQVGYKEVYKKDGTLWEPVKLTDIEIEAIENNRQRRKQKEFEEKCGCM